MFETSKFFVLLFILYIILSHKSVHVNMDLEMSGYRPKEHSLAKHIVSINGGRQTKMFGDNHYCVGSIVSPNAILTAAHCVVNHKGIRRFGEIFVVVGTPFLFTLTPETRCYEVESTIIHPEYRYDTMESDLALLILEEPIEEQNSVTGFTLDESLPRHDTTCVVLGWGPIYKDGPRPNEILYANLNILKRSLCRLEQPVLSSIFCLNGVDDLGQSVWRGDSASPVVCDGKLTGVLSLDNDTNNAPILFSSVYENLNWIKMNLPDESSWIHNSRVFSYFLLIAEMLALIILFEYSFCRYNLN